MGSWGTGISSNDVYEDINYEFFELYNQGMDVSEISKKLIKENQELIDSCEDRNNFWLALAKAQWECKELDPKVYDRIKEIVDSGKDIALWKELDASKSDLTKRQKVLDSFLLKISVEKENAKKRKKKILRDAIFEKGDCLVFKLSDDEFSGVFVLESEKNTEFGLNLIAKTSIKSPNKPTLSDFKKAMVHFKMEEKIAFKNKELTTKLTPEAQISWYQAQSFKKSNTEFEVVGQLKVAKQFDSIKDYQRFSNWDNIPDGLNEFYSDFVNNKCNVSLKLNKLYKKNWL